MTCMGLTASGATLLRQVHYEGLFSYVGNYNDPIGT